MMERCFASNGTPLGPTTTAGPGLSPVIAGAAGVATTWAVTTGPGFGGGAPAGAAGALAGRPGDGTTALAGARAGTSAPGFGAGGRGVLSGAAASPVLGSGAGRGSGTLSAFAAPIKPISATPIPSARLALRIQFSAPGRPPRVDCVAATCGDFAT